MTTYDDELRALITEANSGDPVAGNKLLTLFASLSEDPAEAHPELVRHVARCIGNLLNANPIHGSAAKAMCIQKPKNRVADKSTSVRHVKALSAYYAALAKGLSCSEAREVAGEAGSISPERVHDLVARNKSRAPLEVLIPALMSLTKEQRDALLQRGEEVSE